MAKKAKASSNFWVSYSDLATGLMIVFLLVMIIMIIMQKQNGEIQAERVSEITAKIEIILGQKSKLSESINKAFKDDPSVKADPVTAQISIDQSALKFEENQATLRPSGQRFLQEFTPRYICSLWRHEVDKCRISDPKCTRLDPELPGGVRRINVTGHADMLGLYSNNHALSSLRAEEVTKQMLIFLGKSNSVFSDLPEICQTNATALRTYAEERLWAIGAGETQHCTEKLNNSGNSTRSKQCDSFVDSKESYRRVDFGLELTGDDMTGLLADMVALRKEIGTATRKLELDPEKKEQSERINKLAKTVSEECWKDPSKYHGCKVFARDCLAGREVENCEGIIEGHRTNLKLRNLRSQICRQNKNDIENDEKLGKEKITERLKHCTKD